MHPDLDRIIDLFLDAIRLAVVLLRSAGIEMPASNVGWSLARLPQNGKLPSGATYYRHGYGVEVTTDTLIVDFDFGSRGETNGFDAWRLLNFAQDNKIETPFAAEEDYETVLNDALKAGLLKKRGSLFYRSTSSGDVAVH